MGGSLVFLFGIITKRSSGHKPRRKKQMEIAQEEKATEIIIRTSKQENAVLKKKQLLPYRSGYAAKEGDTSCRANRSKPVSCP